MKDLLMYRGKKMKRIQVTFRLHLPVEIRKKGKWFIANCAVVDVSSQGATEDQARKNLTDALILFFMSCYERGTLDAVSRSCGFIPAALDEATNETGNDEPESFIDVPLPFMIDHTKHSKWRHA